MNLTTKAAFEPGPEDYEVITHMTIDDYAFFNQRELMRDIPIQVSAWLARIMKK